MISYLKSKKLSNQSTIGHKDFVVNLLTAPLSMRFVKCQKFVVSEKYL